MPDSHLNGAYYGPSFPPPSKHYHRLGRRGGGGGCNPFTFCCGCCCSCIFQCIAQIMIIIAFILVLIILALWLIFRPNNVNFYATDASLTQFDLSTTNHTLYYNLALNMTIRNPNKKLGLYYDKIESSAFYEGQRLSTVELSPFYQGHKNTSSLQALFKGQKLVILGKKQISNYHHDRDSGMYHIDVKLHMRIRLKFGWVKSPEIKPKIKCNLQIPLDSKGLLSGSFESKRCGFDW